jgi:argininosuccinate lyase
MKGDGAAELARAGYAWEIADAPLLHEPLTLADLAHVLELVRIDAIPIGSARILTSELLELLSGSPDAVPYAPEYGEMYSSREHYLTGRIGDDAGWLHTGRTRREAMRIAYRILVRRQILDLLDAASDLALSLCEQASAHLETVMPDYTYLQPAEPTTFGHYLSSFIDPVLRDAARLRSEFGAVNLSPMGSGAASGSSLMHERAVAGRDLGFDGPIDHVRDAMWQSDPFTHALLAATTLVVGQDKLAEDLEIFSSREFDFVALGDGLVRPSVLMPQKRNPYALTVIRGISGILVGRATGQLAVAKSPSARSDLYIYAYGEVPRALDLAVRATELTGAVVRTLSVNSSRMLAGLAGRHTQAADIATFMVRQSAIDYRTAHTIVAQAVLLASADARDLSVEDLVIAAGSITNRSVDITADQLSALADPSAVVASHDGLGGAAASAMASYIDERRGLSADVRTWVELRRNRLAYAESDIVRRAHELLDRTGNEGTP